MTSFKAKWGKKEDDVAKIKKQANQEFLQENMNQYKSRKRMSMKD